MDLLTSAKNELRSSHIGQVSLNLPSLVLNLGDLGIWGGHRAEVGRGRKWPYPKTSFFFKAPGAKWS